MFISSVNMFGVRNSLSVSKLRSFSNFLGCSFCYLKHSVRSMSRQQTVISNTKIKTSNYKILPQFVIRESSTDCSVDESYSNIDMQAITEGNDELLKRLKVLILEVDVMRQEGQKVPEVLSNDKWKELLTKPTRSQRIKQLSFWWTNEKKKQADKKKKAEAKFKRDASLKELDEKKKTDHIQYGFGGNTIFLRIYDSTIDNSNNHKLIRAMLFGQNLVVDCSYDEHMTSQEASLCAKQLCIMFAENRLSDDPYNLYFCNANKESKLIKSLAKRIPTMYDDSFPLNITEKCFLDLFPKEKLVYLTPHCRTNLNTYSHDDIYIIGAMVDKVNNDPLSLAKAKALGLRMARFPLDIYLDWGLGTKSLTLNQVQSVLSEMKNSGDWNKAFQHIPKRKLKSDNYESIDQRRSHYLKKKRNLI